MSAYAITPEIYAAWRYLETDDDDLYEREQAEILREEELGLLLAGTRFKFSATKVFLNYIRLSNCRPRREPKRRKTRTIPKAAVRIPVLHTTVPGS